MYRNPEEESAAAAGRIAEHNRIVGLFEGPEGQADARAAHEFWDAEFNRLSNSETHRMSEIAAGLAGGSATVPWMQDVGWLNVLREDKRAIFRCCRTRAARRGLSQRVVGKQASTTFDPTFMV